jgi:hypothetical protein
VVIAQIFALLVIVAKNKVPPSITGWVDVRKPNRE